MISSEGINVRGLTMSELENDGSFLGVEEGVYHIENDVLFFGTFDEATGIPTLEFGRVWEKQ